MLDPGRFFEPLLLTYAAPRGEWQEVSEAANQVPQAIADALRRLMPATAGPLAGVYNVYDIVATPETLDAAVVRLP